jgi:hypothetical protein
LETHPCGASQCAATDKRSKAKWQNTKHRKRTSKRWNPSPIRSATRIASSGGEDLDRHTIGPDPLGHAHLFCMSTELRWVPDGSGVLSGGDVGGDVQASDSWSVRFVPKAEPDDGLHGLITEYWYAEAMDDGTFGVTCQIEYMVCTDVEDPGGTETYAETDYDTGADVRAYETAEAAGTAAQYQAKQSTPDGYAWDGRSRITS